MNTNTIFNRIKEIWNLPQKYNAVLQSNSDIRSHFNSLNTKINELTTVHADVHMKGESQIIVIGRFKSNDYVRAFTVREESLIGLIELLKNEEHGAKVGRFDIRPGLNISALYPRDEF